MRVSKIFLTVDAVILKNISKIIKKNLTGS